MNPEETIRDVKPPLDLPANPLFLYLGLILLVIAIGFTVWYFIQKQKQFLKPVEPPKTAWEAAYEQLAALERENFLSNGKIEPYYFQLSNIVRRYIEDRFDIRAPEMTTEEFLYSLKSFDQLDNIQKDSLKEFLNACDMVKFARFSPSMEEAHNGFDLAMKFVNDTKIEKEDKYQMQSTKNQTN